MSESACKLLLDTNVWLDYYLGDRPQSDAAKNLILYADEGGMTLAYAGTSIKDVFYLIQRDFKEQFRRKQDKVTDAQSLACKSFAWDCVRNMAQIAVAVPVGEPQVWLASHYEDLHGDFEDDLVLAALETSKADFFVTGDEVLRRKAPRGAFDAADMLAYLRMRDEAAV